MFSKGKNVLKKRQDKEIAGKLSILEVKKVPTILITKHWKSVLFGLDKMVLIIVATITIKFIRSKCLVA